MVRKLWVDDLRPPPDDSWDLAISSDQAIVKLMDHQYDLVSLDHDLGDDDTTRVIVIWWCYEGGWPDEVRVHSANPVGREWLEGMIERYKE